LQPNSSVPFSERQRLKRAFALTFILPKATVPFSPSHFVQGDKKDVNLLTQFKFFDEFPFFREW
ncbi:MAG TPA: hypothetical protein VLK33_15410, partial [Terriglobales bacterium]|nr:hypothetical protein [Terriglobales bacterium]